jgi:hypothetical protein
MNREGRQDCKKIHHEDTKDTNKSRYFHHRGTEDTEKK